MDSKNILADVKASIKSILVSNPAKMTVRDLLKDYWEMNGQRIPIQQLGYNNLHQFLTTECSDILKCGRETNPVLTPIITDKLRNINNLITKQRSTKQYAPKRNFIEGKDPRVVERKATAKTNPRLETDVKNITENLKQLLNQHPDGIDASKILGYYFKEFGTTIDFKALGYETFKLFCMKFNDDFVLEKNIDSCHWNLINRRQTPVASAYVCSSDALPGILPHFSLYNDDCMKLGDEIPQNPVTNTNVFAIYIYEVFNPSYFWFQIASEECSVALEKIMVKMTKFYNNRPDSHKMSKDLMIKGQYCAAPYENIYHRGVIVNKPVHNQVQVYFLDYGTLDTVPVNSVYQLSKEFAELPVQAHRGRLFEFYPSGDCWTDIETQAFVNLVRNHKLIANIQGYHLKPEIVSLLHLVDPENVRLNGLIQDILVRKGVGRTYKQSNDEMYLLLSFEDIENGMIQKTDDVLKFIQKTLKKKIEVNTDFPDVPFTNVNQTTYPNHLLNNAKECSELSPEFKFQHSSNGGGNCSTENSVGIENYAYHNVKVRLVEYYNFCKDVIQIWEIKYGDTITSAVSVDNISQKLINSDDRNSFIDDMYTDPENKKLIYLKNIDNHNLKCSSVGDTLMFQSGDKNASDTCSVFIPLKYLAQRLFRYYSKLTVDYDYVVIDTVKAIKKCNAM